MNSNNTPLQQARFWLHLLIKDLDIDTEGTAIKVQAVDKNTGLKRDLVNLRLQATLDAIDQDLGDKLDPQIVEMFDDHKRITNSEELAREAEAAKKGLN